MRYSFEVICDCSGWEKTNKNWKTLGKNKINQIVTLLIDVIRNNIVLINI